MNPNWFGIGCAAAAVIAFFVTHTMAAKMPPGRRGRCTVAALLLAIPGASFAAYYAHWVEVPAWYYEMRSWRGSEALLIFIGIAGGLVACLMGRLTRMLPLLAVVAFVSAPFAKPFLGPFPSGALRDQWQGEVCLQSTYSTCGAASAASILKLHGLTVSEARIAQEAHSYQGGTEVWYLARAMRRRGLDAQMSATAGLPVFLQPAATMNPPPNSTGKVPSLPAIVGVRFGSTGHFIAVLSQDEAGKFHVGDPLRGSERLSREELQARYTFTGFAMHVKKPRL